MHACMHLNACMHARPEGGLGLHLCGVSPVSLRCCSYCCFYCCCCCFYACGIKGSNRGRCTYTVEGACGAPQTSSHCLSKTIFVCFYIQRQGLIKISLPSACKAAAVAAAAAAAAAANDAAAAAANDAAAAAHAAAAAGCCAAELIGLCFVCNCVHALRLRAI